MAKNLYKPVRSTKERGTPDNLHFEKMGESLLMNIVNVSGKRSSYTTMVPKKTMGRGASPTGKSAIRGSTMIHEAHGPSYHITASLYRQNAAEASQTLRETKLLAPVLERQNHVGSAVTFWDKRKFGQKLQ